MQMYCIVLSLFLNHASLFDISPLLLWGGSPLCLRYDSTHKDFLLMNMCAAYLNSQYLVSTSV